MVRLSLPFVHYQTARGLMVSRERSNKALTRKRLVPRQSPRRLLAQVHGISIDSSGPCRSVILFGWRSSTASKTPYQNQKSTTAEKSFPMSSGAPHGPYYARRGCVRTDNRRSPSYPPMAEDPLYSVPVHKIMMISVAKM